jgi:hypothetical protein
MKLETNHSLSSASVGPSGGDGITEVRGYLEAVRANLAGVPVEEQDYLLELAAARVDLALELEHASPLNGGEVAAVLARLGPAAALAERLRTEAPPRPQPLAARLRACRSCRREVNVEAAACPHCGAPYPARQTWRGWGYEWKSERSIWGLPLVHVAFGRDENGRMRVAKGIVAIGQFGVGGITIAQFGIGAIFGLGQFVVAPIAVGQVAVGLAAIGQIAIGLGFGLGQIATGAVAIGQKVLGNWFR